MHSPPPSLTSAPPPATPPVLMYSGLPRVPSSLPLPPLSRWALTSKHRNLPLFWVLPAGWSQQWVRGGSDNDVRDIGQSRIHVAHSSRWDGLLQRFGRGVPLGRVPICRDPPLGGGRPEKGSWSMPATVAPPPCAETQTAMSSANGGETAHPGSQLVLVVACPREPSEATMSPSISTTARIPTDPRLTLREHKPVPTLERAAHRAQAALPSLHHHALSHTAFPPAHACVGVTPAAGRERRQEALVRALLLEMIPAHRTRPADAHLGEARWRCGELVLSRTRMGTAGGGSRVVPAREDSLTVVIDTERRRQGKPNQHDARRKWAIDAPPATAMHALHRQAPEPSRIPTRLATHITKVYRPGDTLSAVQSCYFPCFASVL
ncbi:hypothetical protein B0H13DRAFT_2531018 [Mycena leptocephala]|nr:hypothetical protein B0H13DRAFT_2531018 [Mycena leptocephala]